MPVIALLTDFGLSDGYVGAMKGVIASIAPEATLIDISHCLPPQDIATARFVLMQSAPYFPAGSIILAVVDPGVGSRRRAVALETDRLRLVGPDNGLLSGLLTGDPARTAVELSDPRYWRCAIPSATFHGRDIFAPVAAHLATGMPLTALGPPLDPATLTELPLPVYQRTPDGAAGVIQAIDHFGNLITNLPAALIGERPWQLELAGRTLPGCRTYSDVPAGALLALAGSHGLLEIAANGASAAAMIPARTGTEVRLLWAT